MGSNNSKLIHDNNTLNISHLKNSNYISLCSRFQSLLLCNHRFNSINFRYCYNPRRLCLKKKVLILGLDGVGKTDLFTRLIAYDKKQLKISSLPRPTIGYNVETIKIRSHRQYHRITLWDCGGQLSVRSLWSYHYLNTSLLIWLINIHDRLRLDMNLHLLSQILTNPLLYRVPVLIILYNCSFDKYEEEISNEDIEQNLLTNLEVAFRFLATISTSRASTFKWQVINITLNDNNSQKTNFKKIRQCFRDLMEL